MVVQPKLSLIVTDEDSSREWSGIHEEQVLCPIL